MGTNIAERWTAPAKSRSFSSARRVRMGLWRLTIALRGNQYRHFTLLAGGAITLLAALLAYIFHVNRPAPYIPYHDTWEYVDRANAILSGGGWVDSIRMPGYPFLLAIVFLFAGKDNLIAADGIQLFLFVVAAVEVYVLAYRVWRNTRFAIAIGLLFATNFYFLSFFKAILSDGLATVLTLAVALSVVAFLERPSAVRFWAVAVLLLGLLLTRAEWYLLPIPLFPYLLLMARRHKRALRLLPHVGLATLLTYGVVFLYMEMNAHINGYFGLSDAENINLYGKVTQYHMQGLAPAHYARITAATQVFVHKGVLDPWTIYRSDPVLGVHHFTQMGAYARAIILHHPVEFLQHSVPVALRSLYDSYAFAHYVPAGPFAGVLHVIEIFSALVFPLFILFPFCAAGWLVLLWLKRHSIWRGPVETVVALSLIALYGLVITTLSSYDEYPRLHLDFDGLMLIVIVGSIFLLAGASARQIGADDTAPDTQPRGALERKQRMHPEQHAAAIRALPSLISLAPITYALGQRLSRKAESADEKRSKEPKKEDRYDRQHTAEQGPAAHAIG